MTAGCGSTGRAGLAALAGVLGLLVAAPAARADVVVVKGGALRPPALAALAEAERAMIVCWRAAPPTTVRVALAIDARGLVTASAVTPAAAAQCAAGVLAVWQVPGGAWRGEIDLASRIGADDLAGTISRQFSDRAAVIRACQSVAPAAKGPAIIRVKVHPEGELTDIAVSSKLGKAVDRCIEAAVGGLRLDPLATDQPVAYQLSVTFAGARAPTTPGPGSTTVVAGGGAESPGSVSGPLDAIQVQGVLRTARSRLVACMKGTAAKLDVRFTIRAAGTSKNVVVKDATNTVIDQPCVTRLVTGLRFPKASGETRVVLPLAR